MAKYIVVVNTPNQVATIHSSGCAYLQSYPLDYSSAASRRLPFDDGSEAVECARNAMPDNYGLCRHCLNQFTALMMGRNAPASGWDKPSPGSLPTARV